MPRLVVITTGGTIATSSDPDGVLRQTLSGADLVDGLDVEVVDLLALDSSELTPVEWLQIGSAVSAAANDGADGIVVSNHGGRAENSRRATLTSLPDVMRGTEGRIPVICDGGFRRGTDVFKAMALGATSVGIGRPYIWGLGAFGQEGVEAVLALLRKEFEVAMKQSGTTSLAAITAKHITPA